MTTTVPFALAPEPESKTRSKSFGVPLPSEFLPVREIYFHPELARSRYLPLSIQLASGEVARVRLTSGQVANLLSQLSELGLRAPKNR